MILKLGLPKGSLQEATLGLLKPKLVDGRIHFLIQAGDEALGEACAFSARQAECPRFDFARCTSHDRSLSRQGNGEGST